MRSYRLGSPIITRVLGHAARASVRDARVTLPPEQMPMFIRGLHEGLQDAVEQLALPKWNEAKETVMFADYSDRSEKSGDWTTSAFLCAPHDEVSRFADSLKILRRDLCLEDGRRFEYKSLRDQKRWNAILAWLGQFDSLAGVAFVLLVHKEVISAFHANAASEPDEIIKVVSNSGLGDWTETRSAGKLLEAALRATHVVSYLHAFLAGPDSSLHWISDNDEILAGPTRRLSMEQLLSNTACKYAGRNVVTRISTESELGQSPLRDLLSIPDLIAAGVLEHQRGQDAGATDALGKAAAIMNWFGTTQALQKLALRLTAGTNGSVRWTLYRPSYEIRLPSVPAAPEGSDQKNTTKPA